jgi:hypothetical protein
MAQAHAVLPSIGSRPVNGDSDRFRLETVSGPSRRVCCGVWKSLACLKEYELLGINLAQISSNNVSFLDESFESAFALGLCGSGSQSQLYPSGG